MINKQKIDNFYDTDLNNNKLHLYNLILNFN